MLRTVFTARLVISSAPARTSTGSLLRQEGQPTMAFSFVDKNIMCCDDYMQ